MDSHKSETNLIEPAKAKKWPQILATFIGELIFSIVNDSWTFVVHPTNSNILLYLLNGGLFVFFCRCQKFVL